MSRVFFTRGFGLVIFLIIVLAAVFVVMYIGSSQHLEETMHTGTLFEEFVVAGGPIVWFILIPMSVVMVYLAVECAITTRRSLLLPAGIGASLAEAFGDSLDLAQLTAGFGGRRDFVSVAVLRGFTKGAQDWFRIRDLIFESLQEQSMRFMRKIAWLSLIGNVSPMVGLFGTVVGMIKLFDAIVAAGGQPQPVQLADGISVALVTTFWGLLIAIPALAVYGMFQSRIEAILGDSIAEVENIMPQIRHTLYKQAPVPQG